MFRSSSDSYFDQTLEIESGQVKMTELRQNVTRRSTCNNVA
jgi:hypothetical protein